MWAVKAWPNPISQVRKTKEGGRKSNCQGPRRKCDGARPWTQPPGFGSPWAEPLELQGLVGSGRRGCRRVHLARTRQPGPEFLAGRSRASAEQQSEAGLRGQRGPGAPPSCPAQRWLPGSGRGQMVASSRGESLSSQGPWGLSLLSWELVPLDATQASRAGTREPCAGPLAVRHELWPVVLGQGVPACHPALGSRGTSRG